jgi:predicted nucleotidyltransferase
MGVSTLAESSLSDAERRALERIVESLRESLGERLRSVWLYGSRARGDARREDSDVDLLLVVEDADWDDETRVFELVSEAAEQVGANPVAFSPRVYTPERLAQRREIRSFFIQEVDRDKVVLAGEP